MWREYGNTPNIDLLLQVAAEKASPNRRRCSISLSSLTSCELIRKNVEEEEG